MKKIIFSFLAVAAVVLSLGQLFAAETETGDLVIHFKKWDDNYVDLGFWGWDGFDPLPVYDGLDEFGAYFEINNLPVGAENTFGFKFVERPGGGDPNWSNEFSKDIKLPKSVVKAGETVHVYVFQGATSSEDHPGYYVAKNDAYNLLMVYFDPSGSYETNLGIHHWSGWNHEDPAWGSPLKVFSNAGETTAGLKVKATILNALPNDKDEAPDAGLLIYAGGDENKKTGDVKLLDFLSETPTLGEVGISYVVSMGNAYEAGDNIFKNEDYEDFAEAAFNFKLLPYGLDDNGRGTGTYAIRPDQIIVKTSAQLANPYYEAETEAEQEDALDLVNGWFTVKDSTGAVVEIERVDFALRNETVNDFVVVLKNDLDITKEYTIYFDNGLEGDSNLTADLEVKMDKNGPVITFPLLDEDKIVMVKWGVPFDLNNFPVYSAIDDRDGDVTMKVFVPKDSNSILDTSKVGDYVITLEVSDLWGNVTRETFTFRVSKKVK